MNTYNIDKQFKKFWKISHAKSALLWKIMCFLETKRGQSFVNNLHKFSLKELGMMYGMNLMTINNSRDVYTIIDKAMNLCNIKPTPGAPYKPWDVPEKPDYPMYLTSGRQPIKTIHTAVYRRFPHTKKVEDYGWDIKYRDISDVGLLDNKRIYWRYEYYRDYTKLLEKHKMERWERKHPCPTDTMLKQDLFPEMLTAAWKNRESDARNYIRNLVKEKYDKSSVPCIARVKNYDGTYKNEIVSWISDPHNNISRINNDDYANNSLVRTGAKDLLSYSMNKNVVCGYIQNRTQTLGRTLTMDMINQIAA